MQNVVQIVQVAQTLKLSYPTEIYRNTYNYT